MTAATLCIPAFEASGFIERTLSCAAAQTHEDLRIVVSVDRSEDDTTERCLAHAAEDDRITVITSQRRLGWARNANRALAVVDTPFAALYFHDDILEPDFVSDLIGALKDSPRAASAHCDVERFGSSDERSPATNVRGTPLTRIMRLLVGPMTGSPLRSLFRTESFPDGLRFPAADPSGPWTAQTFLARLFAAGPVVGVERALYRRWIRPGGLTAGWAATDIAVVYAGTTAFMTDMVRLLSTTPGNVSDREAAVLAAGLVAMNRVRRNELRLGVPQPVRAHELHPSLDVVDEAVSTLVVPDDHAATRQGRWLEKELRQLLRAERRVADRIGDTQRSAAISSRLGVTG